MRAGRIPGFGEERLWAGDAYYYVQRGGQGPPLLLLHGFPETSFCWREAGPALAEDFSIVAPDLRGYGDSRAPAGGPRGEGFSKREMAAEIVELMAGLGHEHFAVAGHDRGARVAYRLALEHPDRVTRVAILNTIPTIEQFERMSDGPSLGFWPWFTLAQPAPFAERIIGADPAAVIDLVFSTWPADPDAIGPEARDVYLRSLDPHAIAGICSEYRAAFNFDREHDAEDRRQGRQIEPPLLVVTGAEEAQLAEATEIWRRWANDVTAVEVPGGHFVPEESPRELVDALMAFLGARSSVAA